jgi:adenylate cyclase
MRQRHAEQPSDRGIAFRIGINLGEIIVEADDIYGDGVNIASRIEALAEPGGICVSQIVADQIGDKLGLAFLDIGEHELKNIARPLRVFRVKLPENGTPAAVPPTRTIPGFRDRPAIAVLPFTNMSGDPDQEYFADGLTEDIITALASWRSFPVIARNSVFTYKGRNVNVRTVGRELGAHYVLEGSVRRQDSRVRITAQLIEAETTHHIFADRYDRDVSDVFAVQDEIETSIVGAIEPELLRAESDRAASAPQLFSAYDFLQRGLWHHYRYTAEDNVKAQAFFRKSLAIEPNYALAAAALAVTLLHSIVQRWRQDDSEVAAEALLLAQRAVSLDQRSPQAHYALGASYFHTRNIRNAIREMEDVIRLHPSHAVARANLGNLLNYVNQPELALESVLTAMRLSPNDLRKFLWMPALAGSYYLAGRYEEAIEAGRQGYAMKSDYAAPLRYVAAGLGQLGRQAEAREILPILRRSDGDLTATEAYLRRYYIDETALKLIVDGLRKAGF